MRVLALDTSSRAGSISIVEDDRVIVERVGDTARSHAERLPGELLDILHSASLSPRDVDLFAVASGPGSFTGLRIGIAAMQGMALVNGRPLVAVSALEALAADARHEYPEARRIGVWMDALRGEVFSAQYAVPPASGDDLIEVESASAEPPENVWTRWSSGDIPDLLAGDGATLYVAVHQHPALIAPLRPIAAVLARLAARRAASGTHHPAAVQPLYVRRPDVVMAREAQEARRTSQAGER